MLRNKFRKLAKGGKFYYLMYLIFSAYTCFAFWKMNTKTVWAYQLIIKQPKIIARYKLQVNYGGGTVYYNL